MERRRLRRPSHATIVAYAALFIAIGGTSFAAATIGSGDIKRNAVRSKHVKNGSLQKRDFKVGELPAGARGPQGLRGLRGLTGAAGSAKGFALIDTETVFETGPTTNLPGSKGVNGVIQPDITGVDSNYCFDLKFTPLVGVASIETAPSGGGFAIASVDVPGDYASGIPAAACPVGYRDALVKTRDTDATIGDRENVNFKVIFE